MARAEARQAQAEAAAQTAQTQAAAAQALLQQERAARQLAEARAVAANAAAVQPPPPPPPVQIRPAADRDEARKKELRRQLVIEFSGTLPVRDTPRGLMLTLPGADFQGLL